MYDIAGSAPAAAADGSPRRLDALNAPRSRHLDAGAVIPAVCDEFFFSVTGANAHYGTSIRAHRPAAGRLVERIGLGDRRRRLRLRIGQRHRRIGAGAGPFCGLYGIRPTHGRVDLAGAMAMAPSFDVAGWLANGPGVFQRVGGVLLDRAGVAAPIDRLIVIEDAFAQADAEVAALLRSALDDMAPDLPKARGERVAPDGLDPWRECFRIIQAGEIWQTYGDFVTAHHPRLGPGVRERMEFAAKVSAREAAARQNSRPARDHIRAMTPPHRAGAPTAPCSRRSSIRRRGAVRSRPRHAAHLHRRRADCPGLLPIGRSPVPGRAVIRGAGAGGDGRCRSCAEGCRVLGMRDKASYGGEVYLLSAVDTDQLPLTAEAERIDGDHDRDSDARRHDGISMESHRTGPHQNSLTAFMNAASIQVVASCRHILEKDFGKSSKHNRSNFR
jgi:amidase